jgi:uncharacterized membrane protein
VPSGEFYRDAGEDGALYNPGMQDHRRERNVLIALLLVYALARVLQDFPAAVPTLLIVVLHVLPPAAFALLHGRRLYGARGILAFSAFCLGSGTFFESLSLRTGFPFGHYFFTGVMGPKLLQLPILLALAYLGIGYLAWVLASLLLGAAPGSRSSVVVLPVIASCLMTAWDLAMDPVWCNIDGAWVWKRGGEYFGVPWGNFAGWFLTTWVGYQLFALWLRRRAPRPSTLEWVRLAVLMYGTCALGNLLLAVPSARPAGVPTTISDDAGRHWPTADAVAASVLISLLVMLPFTLLAWVRAAESLGDAAFDREPMRGKSGRVKV